MCFKTGAGDVHENEEETMDLLITLAAILLILSLLGLVTSFTLGGFIHILLVLAIIVVLIRVIQGRSPVV
jgi:FtsH-binding integral membrane protein